MRSFCYYKEILTMCYCTCIFFIQQNYFSILRSFSKVMLTVSNDSGINEPYNVMFFLRSYFCIRCV